MTTLPERWLRLVMAAHDELVIDTQSVNAEAIGNMYCFSPAPGAEKQLTIHGLTDFLQQVLAARREKLMVLDGHPMLFYCWHDAQVRQLRFSLVSISHGGLPFACAYRTTKDMTTVLQQILVMDWLNPDYPEMSEIPETAEIPQQEAAAPLLTVYVQTLP